MMLGLAASVSAQSKQVIGPNPSLPFSAAVKADGLVYVSGSIAASPGADIRKQTQDTLDQIGGVLKQAGSSLANAANVTVYLRNAADAAGMNEVFAKTWPTNPPARTTVVIQQPLASAEGVVEIAMVAIPNGGERVVIHPKDWAKVPAPYSYAIKSGNTLFLSGLVSRGPKDNQNVKGDVTAQTKFVLENGAEILKEAGMSYADVVQSRVFLTDAANFQAMNAAYRPFMSNIPPARVTVQTALTSPDYLVEVSMIAVKGADRKGVTTPNADGTPGRPNPNLSSAVQVGNRLYIAGLTGNTDANKTDATAQAIEVLARTERTLKAAGYDWSHIVDAAVFLADMNTFQAMNAEYRKKFQKDLPARATVGAKMMGGDVLVEMYFTAVK